MQASELAHGCAVGEGKRGATDTWRVTISLQSRLHFAKQRENRRHAVPRPEAPLPHGEESGSARRGQGPAANKGPGRACGSGKPQRSSLPPADLAGRASLRAPRPPTPRHVRGRRLGPRGHGPAAGQGRGEDSASRCRLDAPASVAPGHNEPRGRGEEGRGGVPGGAAPPYLKLLIAREARELPELQLNACDLSHRAVRGPAGRVGGPGADVHVGVRDLGGRLERRHEPIPKVLLMRSTAGNQASLPPGGRAPVPRCQPIPRSCPVTRTDTGLYWPRAASTFHGHQTKLALGSSERTSLQAVGTTGRVTPLTRVCANKAPAQERERWGQTPPTPPPQIPGAERQRSHAHAPSGPSSGGRRDTHSLLQEEVVPGQVVGAQKPPQDADRALKQVDVHVLLEPQLLRHPLPGLFKL